MLVGGAWGQIPMPTKLHLNLLDHPKAALAQLERSPNLVNSVDKDSQETPLHVAAQAGHVSAVRWLLRKGAQVDAKCYNDFTPLQLAANGAVAALLLKSRANVMHRDVFGATAMQFAAQDVCFGRAEIGGLPARHARARVVATYVADRLGVVEAIRNSGVPLDLFSAVCLGKRDLALAKIKARPLDARSVNVDGRTLLHLAARSGDIEIAKALLETGVDVNVGEEVGMNFSGTFTPLADAVFARQVKMVKYLCEKGADPKILGATYWRATRNPKDDIAKILIAYSGSHKKRG